LGGVIVRTEHQAPREHLAERLNMTYEDLSKAVFESESARLASIGKLSTEQHWAGVVVRLGRPASEAKTIREEFFAGDMVDRGLLNSIRALRPTYRTGLISNGWPDLRAYIEQHQFEDAFDALVISAEVGLMKPAPEIYRLAAERLRVQPGQAAFVDDTLANVEAARALGMRGVLFTDPRQALAELRAQLA
jgi:putative hydrolase of the HAD superfamily